MVYVFICAHTGITLVKSRIYLWAYKIERWYLWEEVPNALQWDRYRDIPSHVSIHHIHIQIKRAHANVFPPWQCVCLIIVQVNTIKRLLREYNQPDKHNCANAIHLDVMKLCRVVLFCERMRLYIQLKYIKIIKHYKDNETLWDTQQEHNP